MKPTNNGLRSSRVVVAMGSRRNVGGNAARPPGSHPGSVSANGVVRAVDGARSPYFNTLKRRVNLRENRGTYRCELAEQRTIVVPWLRIPIWTYWRIRVVHGIELGPLEVCARTFLETGHVPAAWFL